MRWPHTVRITRAAAAAAGDQSLDTGVWTPSAAAVTLYNGQGDVQFVHRTLRRGNDRDHAIESNADVFLRDESNLFELREGDTVRANLEDATVEGSIVQIDHLSGCLFCSQLLPVDES